MTTTGRSLYTTTAQCQFGNGAGTSPASPYCHVQEAVNAAKPGDTIYVDGASGYETSDPVIVSTSGISIVGISDEARIETGGSYMPPAITLQGVSNVTISNLDLGSYGSPTIVIKNSSGVTLDRNYVQLHTNLPGLSTISIDGSSSNVTVSRNYLDADSWHPGASGVSIAAGATNVTLASNVLAATGITATGVNGLNVTGNTVQRGCSTAVDIEGASSGVHVENNLFEDANPKTDSWLDGYKSNCDFFKQDWAPDVTVAATAATGTSTDYNAFYVYGTDATAPYSWAGSRYPTIAAFQSGVVGQGVHDVIDTVQASSPNLNPLRSGQVDMTPGAGSAVINSADPNAPGRASSDFFGTTHYNDRGAVKYRVPDPTLSLSWTSQETSAYGRSLTANVSSSGVPLTVTVDWGDGTTDTANTSGSGTVTKAHTYANVGNYRISAAVTDDYGNQVSNSATLPTAGSDYTAYGPMRLLDTRWFGSSPQVGAYSTTRLQISADHGIPAGVSAAVLNVTVTDTTGAGHVTVYGEGDPVPTTSNVNYRPGQTVPNMVVVPVGADGYVDLYNAGNPLDLVVDITGYFTQAQASGYTPVGPARLVDTRSGTGAPQVQVAGNQSIPVQIAGAAGGQLPASGITAVALNVTVTNPRSDGHLTVYPGGQSAPTASNLNFTAGETVANSVVVPVGSDGTIRVLNGAWAPSDVIVDVVGYYSADGRSAYVPVAPDRLLDTRDTTTWKSGPLGGWDYVFMPLSSGKPDITGFVLNATITDTTSAGHLSVAPDPNTLSQYQQGTQSPLAAPGVSSLNWTAPNTTVPNLVQATGGANGIVDLWNASDGPSDLIVDLFGFYQND